VGKGHSTGDGRLLLVVLQALAGPELSATLRNLEDHRGLGIAVEEDESAENKRAQQRTLRTHRAPSRAATAVDDEVTFYASCGSVSLSKEDAQLNVVLRKPAQRVSFRRPKKAKKSTDRDSKLLLLGISKKLLHVLASDNSAAETQNRTLFSSGCARERTQDDSRLDDVSLAQEQKGTIRQHPQELRREHPCLFSCVYG
jgi:hypothetical protein